MDMRQFFSILLLKISIISKYQSNVVCMPSHRMIYYLYTIPREWNEAKILCDSQDGRLLSLTSNETLRQLEYLDENTEWNGNFSASLQIDDLWIGLFEDNSTYFWQECTPLNSWPFWSSDSTTASPTETCVAIDKYYRGKSYSCNKKLNFVCERDDGECWFDPVPFNTTTSGIKSQAIDVVDEAECAKHCRNSSLSDAECWAFSYEYEIRKCYLHFNNDSLAYIKPDRDLIPDSSFIFYTKMCIEGLKRDDNRSIDMTNRDSMQCDGVTPVSTQGLSDVCYCGCEKPPNIFDPEVEAATIDDKVQAIQKELTVDTKNISSAIRKLSSAVDNRPSAVSIGYVGIVFMGVVFGGIMLLDANLLISAFQDLCKKITKSPDESNNVLNK